ncbi:PREDICTED: glutathione S-transferase A1 isoform X1 [Colobus angolensis palliatus]|uniref:glutathione S-transferase A1 isoform X1 n=1 Tax=Colobus angolensis palliatus TaxID=336983 RepID=UPI0005F3B404|nr:PREDICTED: glutathione S-transferase A1 isoform X1 [Colobus angolensis palliatus]
MESTRWLLAAAGVEFEEKFLESAEDLDKLRNDGYLMFQQVPMAEIDGMKLVQTRAILNYIASKYNLYGKDIKERALIDMYTEGIADLGEMILLLPICPPQERDAKLALIKEKTKNRYFPAFEKVLKSHGQDYLVGNKLSRADIHLVELLYYVEELDSSLISSFPLLKLSSTLPPTLYLSQRKGGPMALKTRISNLPTVKKFLQPGSPRKPPMDQKSLEEARKIFRF